MLLPSICRSFSKSQKHFRRADKKGLFLRMAEVYSVPIVIDVSPDIEASGEPLYRMPTLTSKGLV